jgi:hypothetical protein
MVSPSDPKEVLCKKFKNHFNGYDIKIQCLEQNNSKLVPRGFEKNPGDAAARIKSVTLSEA